MCITETKTKPFKMYLRFNKYMIMMLATNFGNSGPQIRIFELTLTDGGGGLKFIIMRALMALQCSPRNQPFWVEKMLKRQSITIYVRPVIKNNFTI